jgi:FkbM family methyltransferase
MTEEPPKHADLIYDIGLHKGEDSEFYLRKGFRVVAFEANPELVAHCKSRLAKYLADGRLTIIEGAILPPDQIAPGQTEVTFYKNEANSVWGTVQVNWAERNTQFGTQYTPLTVPVVNFAEVLRRQGVPHYMKIDIEGCDTVCLDALKGVKERPDYLSIESDKTSLANVAGEIETLLTLGYDRFKAVDQSVIHISQTPPNPPMEGQYAEWRFEHGSSGLFGAELPGKWQHKMAILGEYRRIMLSYRLMGDNGIMRKWRFRGAWRLQQLVCRYFRPLNGDDSPWWYDTHARLGGVKDAGPG